MISGSDSERRRALSNALASITNALWTIQNRPGSWDDKIKTMQNISALIPTVIRCMLWFKNTETKNEPRV